MDTLFPALFRYNEAATEAFLTACQAAPALDPRTERLLAHTVVAGHNWLVRMGIMSPLMDFFELRPLEELRLLHRASHVAFHALLAGQYAPIGLETLIRYRSTQGQSYQQPVQELLFHVLNHSSYHRGQLALLMRAQGLVPPSTDFVYFQRTPEAG